MKHLPPELVDSILITDQVESGPECEYRILFIVFFLILFWSFIFYFARAPPTRPDIGYRSVSGVPTVILAAWGTVPKLAAAGSHDQTVKGLFRGSVTSGPSRG